MTSDDTTRSVDHLDAIDDDLAPFLSALRDQLDSELAADLAAFGPSIATDSELQPFIASLRADFDAHLAAHDPAANQVALPHQQVASGRWRRLPHLKSYAAAGLSAAAAAVVLWVAWPGGRANHVSLFPDEELAAQHYSTAAASQVVQPPRPAKLHLPAATSLAEQPGDTGEAMSQLAQDTTKPAQTAVESEAGRPTLPRVRTEELALRAREAWQRGNLALAQRLFRQVIARDEQADAAQAAFADLFALARLQGPLRAQVQVWRDYLRIFPQGRYAQDARAGLCHTSAGDEAQACWRDYLQHHPNGTHSASAKAALNPSIQP